MSKRIAKILRMIALLSVVCVGLVSCAPKRVYTTQSNIYFEGTVLESKTVERGTPEYQRSPKWLKVYLIRQTGNPESSIHREIWLPLAADLIDTTQMLFMDGTIYKGIRVDAKVDGLYFTGDVSFIFNPKYTKFCKIGEIDTRGSERTFFRNS